MEGDGIVTPDLLKGAAGGPATEIVLGMNLEPGDGGAGGQDFIEVRGTEPEAGRHRDPARSVVRDQFTHSRHRPAPNGS